MTLDDATGVSAHFGSSTALLLASLLVATVLLGRSRRSQAGRQQEATQEEAIAEPHELMRRMRRCDHRRVSVPSVEKCC